VAGAEDTGPIVVRQDTRTVDLVWGFLVVVSGLALFRGASGATGTGRLVSLVVFGGLAGISVAAWVWSRRRPSTLTISPDAISFSHRRESEGIVLPRTGDLYVTWPLGPGGDHRQRYLRVEGSDAAIPMLTFDWRAVERACLARGWRFAGRTPGS
jgi:hypothetical protein